VQNITQYINRIICFHFVFRRKLIDAEFKIIVDLTSPDQRSAYFSTTSSIKVVSTVWRALPVSAWIDCANTCLLTRVCVAYNVILSSGSLTCQLLNDVTGTTVDTTCISSGVLRVRLRWMSIKTINKFACCCKSSYNYKHFSMSKS
jgi:hypothetical protein